ncbi:MAG: hypothetical protein HQ541_11725 [Mariniphaga sp.]|nr:hypothetical protein [Mariniphaga sp.]
MILYDSIYTKQYKLDSSLYSIQLKIANDQYNSLLKQIELDSINLLLEIEKKNITNKKNKIADYKAWIKFDELIQQIDNHNKIYFKPDNPQVLYNIPYGETIFYEKFLSTKERQYEWAVELCDLFNKGLSFSYLVKNTELLHEWNEVNSLVKGLKINRETSIASKQMEEIMLTFDVLFMKYWERYIEFRNTYSKIAKTTKTKVL